MASDPHPTLNSVNTPPTSPSLLVRTRTTKQELRLVEDSIQILKSDIANAEAERLKASRLKEESHSCWNQRLSELKVLKEERLEEKVLAEFVGADLELLRNGIQDKEWGCRLSGESPSRIAQLEESLKGKKVQLALSREHEETGKKKLRDLMTSGQRPKLEGIQKENRKSLLNDGSGDVSEDGARGVELEDNAEHAEKITRAHEVACQEREGLEDEIKFIEQKLKDVGPKVEKVRSEVKLMRAELHLTERQLKEAETRIRKEAQSEAWLERECLETEKDFLEAETRCFEAEEKVRLAKKLMRKKIGERTHLEEVVERENVILRLKQFSHRVQEKLQVPITDHYPNLAGDAMAVKYLNRLVKDSGWTDGIPIWADDLMSLPNGFQPKTTPGKVEAGGIRHWKREHRSSKPRRVRFKLRPLEKLPPYQSPPSRIFQCKTTGEGDFQKWISSDSLSDSTNSPWIRVFRKPVTPSRSKVTKPGKVPFLFPFRRRNRISPNLDLDPEDELNRAEPPVTSKGRVGRVSPIAISKDKVPSFRWARAIRKFSNFLPRATPEYPKLVVVNGVMFRLQHRFSAPEKIYGPLTLWQWRRYLEDRQTHFQFHPSSSICNRLFARFIGSIILGGTYQK